MHGSIRTLFIMQAINLFSLITSIYTEHVFAVFLTMNYSKYLKTLAVEKAADRLKPETSDSLVNASDITCLERNCKGKGKLDLKT